MKKDKVTILKISILLLSLVLVTLGCQGQEGERSTVVEVSTTETTTETQAPSQVLAETTAVEEETEKAFVNPFMDLPESSIRPVHLQLTPGATYPENGWLTAILPGSFDGIQLMLVSDHLKQVQYIEGVTQASETQMDNGLYSYSFQLSDLVPGEAYEYALRLGEEYSSVYTWTTPHKGETVLKVFGDLQGYRLDQYMTFRSLYELTHGPDADMTLLMGDIVDTGDDANQWNFYYQSLWGYGQKQFFAATIGNHDVKGSRDYYTSTFQFEDNGVEGLKDTCGYFDLPYARVMMIDTERPSTFDLQQEWVMDTAEDSDKAFTIVLMHRSVYPIFYVEPHMQVWAETFKEAGIDLVLSGHDHLYSRTQQDATTYIVTGSGSGSKLYDQSEERPWQEFIYDEDYPVSIEMVVSQEAIDIKTTSMESDDLIIVDQFRIEMK